MTSHLLNPDQMREHGIIVNDIPLLQLPPDQHSSDSHCITDPTQNLRIPLHYNKPISYFPICKLSLAECNGHVNNRIIRMTSESPWHPYDVTYNRQEEHVRITYSVPNPSFMSLSRSDAGRHLSVLYSFPDLHSTCCSLAAHLGDQANIANIVNVSAVKTASRSSLVTPEQLSRCWRISIANA